MNSILNTKVTNTCTQAILEETLIPTFVPGVGTVLKPKLDYRVVAGKWTADGYVKTLSL